jgi:hypothetical protein
MANRQEGSTNPSDDILRQLNEQAVPREFIMREGDLFRARVSLFANLIRADVNEALTKGPADEVAAEYLKAATELLSASGSDSESLETASNGIAQAELEAVIGSIRKEIAAELLKGNLSAEPEEIEEHTIELAQCVLSNWFALLHKALRLRARNNPIALSPEALPLNPFAAGLLYEGVEGFALPLELVQTRFGAFLDKVESASAIQKLTAKLFQSNEARIVELAPDLVLVSPSPKAWHLTASREEAEALVLALEKSTRKFDFDPICEQFNQEWAMSAVRAMAWPTQEPAWDPLLVKQIVRLAVRKATAVPFHVEKIRSLQAKGKRYGDLQGNLVHVTAELIGGAANQASLKSSVRAYELVQKCVFTIKADLEKGGLIMNVPNMEMCQILVATATGAAAETARIQSGSVSMFNESAEYLTVSDPNAQEVMELVAVTTRTLLQSPEVQTSINSLVNAYSE